MENGEKAVSASPLKVSLLHFPVKRKRRTAGLRPRKPEEMGIAICCSPVCRAAIAAAR
jgi:hypothetical protein